MAHLFVKHLGGSHRDSPLMMAPSRGEIGNLRVSSGFPSIRISALFGFFLLRFFGRRENVGHGTNDRLQLKEARYG